MLPIPFSFLPLHFYYFPFYPPFTSLISDFPLSVTTEITSCAGGRHNMPPPLQVDLDLLSLKVVS